MALESFMVDRSSPPGGPQRPPLSAASLVLRLGGIAVVVAAVAGAFAYVHGNFDPQRLTPKALVSINNLMRSIIFC